MALEIHRYVNAGVSAGPWPYVRCSYCESPLVYLDAYAAECEGCGEPYPAEPDRSIDPYYVFEVSR